MSLHNAEVALLGLLSEEDRYPYQIEQEVKQRDLAYWTQLSMSSIYKILRKLESRGLVESRVEVSDENRTRKIYRITGPGIEELRAGLRAILSEPEHLKWQIDLGVSNLAILGTGEAIDCLKQYAGRLRERISGYGDLERYLKEQECPEYRLALARRPRRVLQAELDWVVEYAAELEASRV